MSSFTLKLAFFCIVAIQLLPISALRSRGYGSKYNKETPAKQAAPLGSSINTPTQNTNTVRRGLGISAWGLITLVISIILAMAGMYYFSICYPVLCKKTRKYDMIHSPNVA